MIEYATIAWLAIGLSVGIGSKILLPGRASGSWMGTIMLSVTGALIDGWSGSHLLGTGQTDPLPGLVSSLIGAVFMLAIYRFVLRRNMML